MPHGVNKPGVEAGELILSPVQFMGWGSCCQPGVRKAAEPWCQQRLLAAPLLCSAQAPATGEPEHVSVVLREAESKNGMFSPH